MLQLLRTDSNNPDFRQLVALLDHYLATVDGDDHAFYSQFNKIDNLRYCVVAFWNDQAVGCGAIREYSPDAVEVKRMFVSPEFRGKGVAALVLTELENWAGELGYARCMLETGKRQVEAIRFYQKSNYQLIPNFGQYAGVDNSVCMEKWVKMERR